MVLPSEPDGESMSPPPFLNTFPLDKIFYFTSSRLSRPSFHRSLIHRVVALSFIATQFLIHLMKATLNTFAISLFSVFLQII